MWEVVLQHPEVLSILVSLFVLLILLVVFLVWPKLRKLSYKWRGHELSIEKGFQQKVDQLISKLEIVDGNLKGVPRPFPLQMGQNIFKCLATYADGTREQYNPYWLCWPQDSRNGTEVFGRQRKDSVNVTYQPNHERYTELSCWVFPPNKNQANAHIPHDSIGLLYQESDGKV